MKELIGRSLRDAKIKELKANIKLAGEVFRASRKFTNRILKRREWFIKRKYLELAERLMTLIKKRREIDGQARMIVEALGEELKMTRLNKYSSSFFEYYPSPMNRRMRRALARKKL